MRSYTLIELIITVAIILILVSLLAGGLDGCQTGEIGRYFRSW